MRGSVQQLHRRGAVHSDAFGDPDRSSVGAIGDLQGAVSREGKGGLTPWEYTIADLLSDAGYVTALFG
jgi:arylsulfatase A-like enzyme